MPENQIAFDIDDTQNLDVNLTSFAARLAQLDAGLAPHLEALLQTMSRGSAVDRDQLWDEMFASTAPAPEPEAGEGDAANDGAAV